MLQFGWMSLSIIFVIFISLSKVLLKVSLKGEETHPIALSIYLQVLVSLMILPKVLSNIGTIPNNLNIWLLVLLTSLIYAGANVFYFYALREVEVSQVDILSSTRAIWFLIGGLIVFKEVITLNKIFGVILIIAGLCIIYWKKRSFQGLTKQHVYVLVCAVFYGIASILDKYLNNYFESSTYMFLDFLVPSILTAIFIPSSVLKIKTLLKVNKTNAAIIGSAALTTLATLALFSAYKVGGEISKVGPITLSSVVVTVVLGILFLGERDMLWKKIVGSVVVFVGVYFVQVV